MPNWWLPWKYAVAFAVVYFPVRQVASWGVAVTLAFASFPIVWWAARRVGDRQAEAELRQPSEERGLRSRAEEIVSSLNPVGHRPLPPLHEADEEHQER
jgi:hypothetical protein